MKKIQLALSSLFLYLISSLTAYAGTEIIPYTGYKLSGEFEEIRTNSTIDVEDGESYGLVINIDSSKNSQYELLYSMQSSKLKAGAVVPTNTLFDIDIEYFHIGGSNLYPMNEKTKSYISAGLGITRFNPDFAGFSTESKFSINISGGIKKQFSDRLGLRLGVSLFATPVNSNSAIFCGSSSGCAIHFAGNFFTQFEASAGLIFKF